MNNHHRRTARRLYESGAIDIPQDAEIRTDDDGADGVWVAAWVFVPSSVLSVPVSPGLVAIIDAVDADLASDSWYRAGPQANYATRSRRNLERYMHRIVYERLIGRALLPGEEVDHDNRDKLDNRRCNLRLATPSQNAANSDMRSTNSSGFRGVYLATWTKARPWRALLMKDRKSRHLGYYETAEEAARAYDRAARDAFGEFAALNYKED